MNTENNAAFNMDALLDGTLDDLADLPSIERWASGTYEVQFKWEQKVVANHPSIEVKMHLREVIEIAAGETPPDAKAETSVLYMLDNPVGQGKFKELVKTLADCLGMQGKSNREILEAFQGAIGAVVLTKRQRKKDGKLVDGVFDNDIVTVQIA